MSNPPFESLTCPAPRAEREQVLLGHGSGGRLSAELLRSVILPELGREAGEVLEDQAALAFPSPAPSLAFTTDAFVVRPLFFPGGDIGRLAVHGTVNDLAVGGAEPLFLSAAFILEEGLPLDHFRRILRSMRAACEEANLRLVTGDTKVVDRGKGDGVFIATSGIGRLLPGARLSIAAARPGDRLLVSGTVGDHGLAILSVREGLEFETELVSDTAPLHELTRAMLTACPEIRCMRDPTRGGLASVLHELAEASRVGVELFEEAVPLQPAVRAACELLGLDPLHAACEGRLLAVVPPRRAEELLAVVRRHPLGQGAALVGEVTAGPSGSVVLRTALGTRRALPPLAGEQLPRIC